MITAAELLVRYRSDTSDLDKGAQKAGSSLSGMADKASRAGRGLTIGVTAPLAFAAKASIDAASDVAESTSKNEVLFGQHAKGISSWSETAASSMGVSKRAALDATGVFGNLITNMDIAKGPAADMSKNMVQLAADVGSFNNASSTEVLDAMRAGLVGETTALKRFGVNINAARIEQEAMNAGLVKEGEELTDAAKAQAVYNLMLKDTTAAQGDFARTADGAANKQKIMAARVDDLRAKIGAGLMPIWQGLLGAVSSLIGLFEKLGPTGQKVVMVVLGIVAAVGPLLIIGAKLVQSFLVIKKAMVGLNLAFMANPFVLLGIAIVALVYIVVKNWDTIKRVLLGGLKAIMGFFRASWDRLKAITRAVWNGIKAFVVGLWRGIVGAAKAIWNGLVAYFRAVFNIYRTIFSKAWEIIRKLAVGAWKAITGAVRAGVSAVLEWVRGLPGRVVNNLGNLASLLWNAGKDLIGGLISGIKNALGALWDLVGDIPGKIIGTVKDKLGIGSPSKVFAGIGRDTGAGLVLGLKSREKDLLSAGRRYSALLSDSISPRVALAGAGLSGGSSAPAGLVSSPSASGAGSTRDLATAFSRALDDHDRKRRSRRAGDLREKISLEIDGRTLAEVERRRALLMGEIV